MQKAFFLFLAAVMAFQPSYVMAQTSVAPVPVGVNGTLGIQAGDYYIREEKIAGLLENIMTQAGVRQQADRDYLINSLSSIQSDYEELVRLVTSGEEGTLLQLSQQSQQNMLVDSQAFFNAINSINQQVQVVQSRITALTSVNPETLPSSVAIVNDGKNTQTLPNFGQINWNAVIGEYSVKIKGLVTAASNLPVTINFQNSGKPEIIPANSGKTLNPIFKQPVLTGEQIRELQTKAARLSVKSRQFNEAMAAYNQQIKTKIQQFVTDYGTEERYRFRDDGAILESTRGTGNKEVLKEVPRDTYYGLRSQKFKEIVDAFWQRSYLRVAYGQRLGAIQPADYQKRWLNIDKFTVATEALRVLRQEVAMSDAELDSAADNMRMILKVVDERSSHIFGDKSSSNWLVKGNSLITFIGGRRASAEAIFMVMQLVAADIKEESTMAQAGGLANLREFYGQRYQSTAESKAYFKDLRCALDQYSSGDCEGVEADPYGQDVVEMNANTIRGAFALMNDELYSKTADLEQARQIRDVIKTAQMSSQGAQNVNRRKQDL